VIFYSQKKNPKKTKGDIIMEQSKETLQAEEVKVIADTTQPDNGPEKVSEEPGDLLAFVAEQKAHNQKIRRLMQICAGCMIGILAIALLTAALILPRVLGILSDAQEITAQVQEMTGQAESVLTDAREILGQVKDGNPKQLMDSIGSLAREGESAVLECVEQVKRAVDILDKMDIESLNTAIDNLGKAISPLARLFGSK